MIGQQEHYRLSSVETHYNSHQDKTELIISGKGITVLLFIVT